MKTFLPFFLAFFFLFVASASFSQNIALGKQAYSSGNEWDGNNPYMAIDGRGGANSNGTGGCNGECSRWSSTFADNQWIYIDLAGQYQLTEVKLFWEGANGRDYLIQVSNNATDWTTVHTITNNSSFNLTYDMTGQTARYVRMFGQTRNTGYGFSLWEFEVYGTPVTASGTNLAIGLPATASSQQHGGASASNAVDGNGGGAQANLYGGCTGTCTSWNSANVDDSWIYVDMGYIASFTKTVLYWEGSNYAKAFDLEVSNNTTDWTKVAGVTQNFGSVNTVNLEGASGRYIRMHGIQRNTASYNLYEFEVYSATGSLPVHLVSFTGALKNNQVELEWKASMDQATEFEVERSLDGKSFASVGRMFAPNSGSGTFRFTDTHIPSGRFFYRLKATELGQSAIYSSIINIVSDETNTLNIFPNPVTTGSFHVQLGISVNEQVDLKIFNTAGMLVQQERLQGNGRSEIAVRCQSALKPGVYVLQAAYGGQLQRTRLVIAK